MNAQGLTASELAEVLDRVVRAYLPPNTMVEIGDVFVLATENEVQIDADRLRVRIPRNAR